VETESYCVCSGGLESVEINDSAVLMVIKRERECNLSANKSNHPN
jgi:hypothetical protein